jgi:prophage antirepressor-like protein
MNNNQILLSYPDGGNEVRTIFKDEIYFCLHDVIALLAHQNTTLANSKKPDGLFGLIKAQSEVLEEDEKVEFESELYITQPGLFRIILRDNSQACKNFQRWVLHEVLPCIQKHGTYPAPLVESDSDVKRIVQSLLLEIEQRERLEKETKEQFKAHERVLNNLSEKIESISSNNDNIHFIDPIIFCKTHKLDKTKIHSIRGWCIKLCAENGYPSFKRFKDGSESLEFTEETLIKALNEIKE